MSNLALYQLSGQLQQIAQQRAEDGLDPQTIADTLESISGDFEDKAKQIVSIARQTASNLHRRSAPHQNRNAIPAFLTVPDRAIASLRKLSLWKLLLRRL